MNMSVILEEVEGGFTAFNMETELKTQGATREEALAKLKEAIEHFLEVTPLNITGIVHD